ncbi:MAG TPA: OmpA family protein [Alphaproteobacteria bacterium]
MYRLILVALLAATTLIGCVPLRQGNTLGYDFAVTVDRAELPDQSCKVDLTLHNNLDSDFSNFEYGLNFFDSLGRWAAGPVVQGDFIATGGVSKQDFIFPVACDRLASATVAKQLCLDIIGMAGRRLCYDIGQIVINDVVRAEVLGPPEGVEAPPAGKPRFYTLFFDWDKSDINDVAQLVIDAIVADWTGLPDSLQLVGHADRSGPVDYNQKLSERRVASVAQVLIGQGIEAERVSGYGLGETDPLVPTPDGVREPRNRRVVVTLETR